MAAFLSVSVRQFGSASCPRSLTMTVLRTTFSRLAPALAHVRSGVSITARRAALARGYASQSENLVGTPPAHFFNTTHLPHR